jgi:hypothetical protein
LRQCRSERSASPRIASDGARFGVSDRLVAWRGAVLQDSSVHECARSGEALRLAGGGRRLWGGAQGGCMSAHREGGGAPPSTVAQPGSEAVFELAALSDVGTDRPENEDSCGHWIEHQSSAVFAVADGVGGYEGGEIASKMAIETTLEAYRESPVEWRAAKRLHRAVQRANIEIHDRALIVPELRRMATTLTAVAVVDGTLYAAHVGDSRLYLVRHERAKQITKDHTVIAERVRMGVMSAARARGTIRSARR